MTGTDESVAKAGSFVGFTLLSSKFWDQNQFIHDLSEDWGILAVDNKKLHSEFTGQNSSDLSDLIINEQKTELAQTNKVLSNDSSYSASNNSFKQEAYDIEVQNTLFFEHDNMLVAISYMDAPIPFNEAEECAKNNYLWEEAESVARAHQAHLMVAILAKEQDVLERGKLFVKVLSTTCKQKNASAIYSIGSVFSPSFYMEYAQMIKEGELPIFNWIWFGLYLTNKGISCYTYGMDHFGKDNIEVLNAPTDPATLTNFVMCIVNHVLELNVTLREGETIGFSDQDMHLITRSRGVALPDEKTIKITFENIAPKD